MDSTKTGPDAVAFPPAATGPGSGPGLEADLGWSLRAVSKAFAVLGADAVEQLPGRQRGYLALVAAEAEQSGSQLAIARRLGLDRTVMTYLLDSLVEQNLVERQVDPRDRRARIIVLTSTGRQALEHARASLRAAEDHLLAPLGPVQREEFRRLLLQIAAGAGWSQTTPPTTPAATQTTAKDTIDTAAETDQECKTL